MSENIPLKVVEYEKFLNETLRSDLRLNSPDMNCESGVSTQTENPWISAMYMLAVADLRLKLSNSSREIQELQLEVSSKDKEIQHLKKIIAKKQTLSVAIVKYEENTLKNFFKYYTKILEARDKIYSQTAEYLQLKNVIERIKETDLSQDELKTKVDLGCNFYCQANVPDASKIFLCVGFGFYVEFTLEEALRFIEKKTARLTEEASNLTKDANKVKANINIILEGLKEMQHLDMSAKKEQRDIWS